MVASLTQLLREIAGSRGELRSDLLVFRGSVPTSGDVTQPDNVSLHPEYDYFLTELRASCTIAGSTNNAATADANFDDIDQIRFNTQVTGTGESLFTSDVELMGLVAPFSGEVYPIRFDPGGIAIAAGKVLKTTITRRASSITTARVVTVTYAALMVPKGYQVAARSGVAS